MKNGECERAGVFEMKRNELCRSESCGNESPRNASTRCEAQGIELIVVDLDGTAINHLGEVENSTLEAFEAFRKRGTKIAIATGRSPRGAAHQIRAINPDFCILSGGAHIELNGEVFADFRVDFTLTWEIIEMYRRRGCGEFVITTPSRSYINKKLGISDESFHIRSFDEPFACEVIELSCNMADDELERHVLSLDPTLEITRFSIEDWRRYAHRDANKGKALEIIMDRIGIDPRNVVAFGDDYNDISMFQKVGYSVAMANAPDEIKLHARYRCGGNHEQGISRFLNDLASQRPFCIGGHRGDDAK